MSGFELSVAEDLADAFLNGTSYTPPVPSHVRLHTGDPGADGTEDVVSSYGYVAVSFAADGVGGMINTSIVSWVALPVVLPVSSTYLSVWDGDGGNFIASQRLTLARSIPVGQTLAIRPGYLRFGFLVAT